MLRTYLLRWRCRALLGTAVLCLANDAFAGDGFVTAADLAGAATAFATAELASEQRRVEVTVGRMDARLQLAACEQPLQGFLPQGTRLRSNISIGVRCSGPRPWTAYVPATVKVFEQVVVAKRPLLRNSIVGAGDLAVAERDVGRLSAGFVRDPSEAIGKKVTRALSAESVVTPQVLTSPPLVKRGEVVVILATAGGIAVRMHGKVLSDGGEGDVVRVRNLRSNRVVNGQVTARGVVQVAM